MRTLLPEKFHEPDAAITIPQLSRERYGRDRQEVEARILQAWQAEEEEAEDKKPMGEYVREVLAEFNEDQLEDENTDQQDERLPDESED